MNAHQDAQEGQQTPAPAGVASVPTVDAAAVLATHHPFRGAMAGVAVNCRECGTPWRGDAETGGCEAVLLARRVIELEAEREDREDYARMRVKQYSAEVSGPNLAEAEAELAALRERAERAEAALNVEVEEGLVFVGESLVIADRLARRGALLEGLLRSVEWIDDHGPTPETDWCPACGWGRGEGHNPKCRLAVALADGG